MILNTYQLALIAALDTALEEVFSHGSQVTPAVAGYDALRHFQLTSLSTPVDETAALKGSYENVFAAFLQAVTPAWNGLSLAGSWSTAPGYLAPAYSVDLAGRVHFRGQAIGGAAGSTLFTLPTAVLPAADLILPAWGQGSSVVMTALLVNHSTGVVTVAPNPSQTYTGGLSLECISYSLL